MLSSPGRGDHPARTKVATTADKQRGIQGAWSPGEATGTPSGEAATVGGPRTPAGESRKELECESECETPDGMDRDKRSMDSAGHLQSNGKVIGDQATPEGMTIMAWNVAGMAMNRLPDIIATISERKPSVVFLVDAGTNRFGIWKGTLLAAGLEVASAGDPQMPGDKVTVLISRNLKESASVTMASDRIAVLKLGKRAMVAQYAPPSADREAFTEHYMRCEELYSDLDKSGYHEQWWGGDWNLPPAYKQGERRYMTEIRNRTRAWLLLIPFEGGPQPTYRGMGHQSVIDWWGCTKTAESLSSAVNAEEWYPDPAFDHRALSLYLKPVAQTEAGSESLVRYRTPSGLDKQEWKAFQEGLQSKLGPPPWTWNGVEEAITQYAERWGHRGATTWQKRQQSRIANEEGALGNIITSLIRDIVGWHGAQLSTPEIVARATAIVGEEGARLLADDLDRLPEDQRRRFLSRWKDTLIRRRRRAARNELGERINRHIAVQHTKAPGRWIRQSLTKQCRFIPEAIRDADGELQIHGAGMAAAVEAWKGIYKIGGPVGQAPEVGQRPEDQSDTQALNGPDISSPFTYEELQAVLHDMADKAPGKSGITVPMIRHAGPEAIKALVAAANDMWETGDTPPSWRTSVVRLLYKGGDRTNPLNYRPIALQEVGYKIVSAVLARRVNTAMEAHQAWATAQRGFRKRCSAVEHVLSVVATWREQVAQGRSRHVAFVDFRKAYDSITFDALESTLRWYGMNHRQARVIRSLQERSKIHLVFGNKLSCEFAPLTGVKQGDPAAPGWFNLVLNRLLRIWERQERGPRLGGLKAFVARAYADDMIITADSQQELLTCLQELHDFGCWCNLRVSADKSKAWDDSAVEGAQLGPDGIKAAGPDGQYRYLGFQLRRDGKWDGVVAELEAKVDRLAAWLQPKRLAVEQKVWAVNTMIGGTLLYTTQVCLPSQGFWRRAEARLLRAVCHGVTTAIWKAKAVLNLPASQGGAGLVAIESRGKAIAITAAARWANKQATEGTGWEHLVWNSAQSPLHSRRKGAARFALDILCEALATSRPQVVTKQYRVIPWSDPAFGVATGVHRHWESPLTALGARAKSGPLSRAPLAVHLPAGGPKSAQTRRARLGGDVNASTTASPPYTLVSRDDCDRPEPSACWAGCVDIPLLIATDAGGLDNTWAIAYKLLGAPQAVGYRCKATSSSEAECAAVEHVLQFAPLSPKMTLVTDSTAAINAATGPPLRDGAPLSFASRRIRWWWRQRELCGSQMEIHHIHSHQSEKRKAWSNSEEGRQKLACMQAENDRWEGLAGSVIALNEDCDREATHRLSDPSLKAALSDAPSWADDHISVVTEAGTTHPITVGALLPRSPVASFRWPWTKLRSQLAATPHLNKLWWQWRLAPFSSIRHRSNARRTFATKTWDRLRPEVAAFWDLGKCPHADCGVEKDSVTHRILWCNTAEAVTWRQTVMRRFCNGRTTRDQWAWLFSRAASPEDLVAGRWLRPTTDESEETKSAWSVWCHAVVQRLLKLEQQDWQDAKKAADQQTDDIPESANRMWLLLPQDTYTRAQK